MSSSGQNVLDADPFGLDRSLTTPERKVIVLWDYENCPVPKGVSGLSVIRNIREAALKFGSIDQFEAYCDWSSKASTNIKNDLSISGVKLRDCPKKGWIDTVDKTIVVDMVVYALERPRTTTILLISGDRDHAYAISTLRNRGYPVKLIAPSGTLHSGLQLLADLLNWDSIVKPDLPPTDLAHFSALARGEEEETEEEEEEGEEEDASEGEDEDEYEDEDVYAEGEWEEEEIETEEMAQVPIGLEAEADETAQVQVGAEAEVEGSVQLQAEAEKKVQVLVETDDEGDSGEPALPTPPQSESVATVAPAETTPAWITAKPALRSKAALLGLIATRAQDRQEERLQSPSLRSPSPPTRPQTVSSSFVGESSQPEFGASFIQQPQTVLPSYDGGSSQSRFWGSFVQQPYWLPSYVGGSSLPVFGASSIQQTRTVAPSYGVVSNQPGLGASVVQQPARYRYVPPKFEPLVRELEVMGAAGSLAPSWNHVCPRVKKRCRTYLKAAGVKRWKDYLLLAEQEGLVILAGWSGKETVSLRI